MLVKTAHNARQARNSLEKTLEAFRNALTLRDEQLSLVSQLYDDMLATCNEVWRDINDIPSVEFLNKRRTFIHESLKLDRDLEALRSEMSQIVVGSWIFNI